MSAIEDYDKRLSEYFMIHRQQFYMLMLGFLACGMVLGMIVGIVIILKLG